MLKKIFEDVLQLNEEWKMYYMTSIRADAAVCSRSSIDGKLYFNLIVFQQQQAFDPSRGELVRDIKRTWQYWVQRAATAVAVSAEGDSKRQPTGLYDKAVRARFKSLAVDPDWNKAAAP